MKLAELDKLSREMAAVSNSLFVVYNLHADIGEEIYTRYTNLIPPLIGSAYSDIGSIEDNLRFQYRHLADMIIQSLIYLEEPVDRISQLKALENSAERTVAYIRSMFLKFPPN